MMETPYILETAVFYSWWLLINGVVFWAEYDFLRRFFSTGLRRKRDLCLYLFVNISFTPITLAHPLPSLLLETIHLVILCLFVRVCLLRTWADGMAAGTIILTLSTFMAGISAVVMRFLVTHLTNPQLGYALQILLSILTTLLLLLSFRLIAKRYRAIAAKPVRSYLYVLLLPCAFVVWVIRYGLGLDKATLFPSLAPLVSGPSVWTIACLVGACVTFFVILEVFEKVITLSQQETERVLLAAQLREQRTYLAEASQRADQYRAFQHDINNHLLIVSGLCQAEQYAEVDGYLKQLTTISHRLLSQVSTGNSVLDVLLSEKIRYAEQNKISVSHRIHLPDHFPVDALDLCILFSNAMDNAIQACTQESETQRHIDLVAQAKHQFFLIELTNPSHSTTPVQRGTGLRNMEQIAGKYGGTVEIEQSASLFRLSILLCWESDTSQPLTTWEKPFL